MRKLSLALLLLAACGGDDDSDVCVFGGRYELGVIPTNGCMGNSATVPLFGEEPTCSRGFDQVGLNGARQNIFISCIPGDPVIECEGFASDSNGCQYDVYMRRLSP